MPRSTLPVAWRLLVSAADPLLAAGGLAVAFRAAHGAWPVGPALLVVLLAPPLAILLGLVGGLGPVLRSTLAVATAGALAGCAGRLCGLAEAWPWTVILAAAAGSAAIATVLRVAAHAGGTGLRRCVLVGNAGCRRRLREHLASRPDAGLAVVAEVGPDADPTAAAPGFAMGDLDRVVQEFDADEVLLSTGLDDRLLVLETMSRLLERPLVVRYVPDPEALPLFFPRPTDVAGMPAIDLSRGPLSPGAEVAKWVEDKVVAVVALAILGLPMLLIAALIRLTSPGPALFIQERHGQYGRMIRVLKFRTMRAEHCTRDVSTGTFKQAEKGDLRVTRLGRFLRNTSLDELPQFLNVLLGDMSVVGPRPHVVALNRRFAGDIGELMRRHYVKPGITGLAQISGARGETRTVDDMRRRVAFDLEYLRRWSLWLDLGIIARTVVAGWVNRHP